jgi:hypothetical protein
METLDPSSFPTAFQGAVSRRGFITLAGGSLAAGALSACGSDSKADSETSEFGDGDIGILNFLLTVEYVQAAFYKGLTGSTLYSEAERNALGEFGEQDEDHADALKKRVEELGGDPAAKPKTKFTFNAGPATLELAGRLENTGAAAYRGQLPNIDDAGARDLVITIYSVEGRHAAAINYLQQKPITPDGAFAKPATVESTMTVLKPHLAAQ